MTRARMPDGAAPVVVVDAFPEAALHYGSGWAVVAVDVIRASTTAVTAAAAGRRCFPAASLRSAFLRAGTLVDPLLAGEIGGERPEGFEMTNSPAEMASRSDPHRPAVLVSSSGTALMCNAARSGRGYVACLRNAGATARHMARRYPKVAVVGAGSRGEFREEDQACCAKIAADLVERGFQVGSPQTAELLHRWDGAPLDSWLESASVRYLRSTAQERDLDFVLSHHDDLDLALRLWEGELQVQAGSEDADRCARAPVSGAGASGRLG